MSKARNILGAITGGILILSAGAHSFLGWKSMREQLVSGVAAYAVSRTLFFVNIFLVPGILILIASSERDEA
jgi:hypothetical protein